MRERLEPILPDIARGFRAAFATLVPFYLARRFAIHELAWTALGGWLGTLADPGGLRLGRAKVLGAFAVGGTAVVFVSELACGSAPSGVLTLAALAFLLSLLRAIGAASSAVGSMLLVAAAIALGGLAGDPARDALGFLGGATWALVFSSIVWPVWTHMPVRVPLARCWHEIGAYVEALDRAVAAELKEGDPEWSTLARTHQAKLRASIEEARAMAIENRARRSGESVLGSNLRTLLALAERLLPLLVAAMEGLEVLPLAERTKEWAPAGAALAEAARDVARVLETPTLKAQPHAPVDREQVHGLFRRIVDASEMSVQIARNLGTRPEQGVPELGGAATARRVLTDDLRVLRDALSPRSTYFHHAIRVAVAVLVAQLVGRMLSPAHVSWVTIPTIGVLQPYAGATVKRAAERVVGTVVGGLVAVAIMMTLRSPIALSLVMVPLSVASVATKPRSYRLFTLFLTPVFVLLAERFDGDWWTAAARAGDAVLGGALALAAALVFPSREDARLEDALTTLMDKLRRYADVALDAYRGGTSSSAPVVDARRDVGVALGNAETSLERLLSEPLRSKDDAEAAMLLVTHGRRFAGAITSLDQRHTKPDANQAKLVDAVRARIDRVLSEGPTVDPSPVPSEQTDLTRIVRQADLIARVR